MAQGAVNSYGDLRDFQRQGESFIYSRRRGQLWLDVGAGKTATVLAALQRGFLNAKYIRALVISTKAIASSVWQEEVDEWDFLRGLETRSLVGIPGPARAEAFFEGRRGRLDSINFNHIPWLEKQLEERKCSLGDLYDVVIVDEFSKLKNSQGAWFRALAKMVHPDHVPYFWALSGSPAAEGYHHLWAPMFLVDYGIRLGYTKKQFEEKYFFDYCGKLVLKHGAAEKIEAALKDVVFSVDLSGYNFTPPIRHKPRMLSLPPQYQDQYQELEEEMMLNLKEGDVIAANAGVLCGKCMQFTSGAMYLSDELGAPTKKWETINALKLHDLEECFERRESPMLVSTWFKHEGERIKEHFGDAAVMMNSGNYHRVKDDWNARRIPMMVTNPMSTGHGVNLQRGGHEVYWFTVPYSCELFEQLPGRLARQGQRSEYVNAHAPLIEGTVDIDAWTAATTKQALQDVLKKRMAA